MLRLMHVEEIGRILLLLPNLVLLQQQRSNDFAPNAGTWLNTLEKTFAACGLSQAGTIAMLRSELANAEQGQVPAGLEFRGQSTRTRVVNAVASQVLQRATEVASTLLGENRPRFAEAERIALELVALVLSRGLIPAWGEGVSNSQYLRNLRQVLLGHDDLKGAIVHLEGLVGPNDALIFLDRALAAYLDAALLASNSVTAPFTR